MTIKTAAATVRTKTTVTTSKEIRIEIGRCQLKAMLRAAGIEIANGANIYIAIPGGADWSNTDLEICEEHPIIVEWTEVDTVNDG